MFSSKQNPYGLQRTLQRAMTTEQLQPHSQRSSFSSSRIGSANVKDWLEEIIDFTSMLTRRMQYTLGRIKIDFMRTGMKFDADFRDHFLYIANNR